MGYPHKWSVISYGSSMGQESSSVIDRRSTHWATQPTMQKYFSKQGKTLCV